MALGAGDGGALPLAYETASPWDIWVEGRYSAFDDDAANLGRDGHVGVLYVGSDYRVTQNMIVGALVQFDWAKDDFRRARLQGRRQRLDDRPLHVGAGARQHLLRSARRLGPLQQRPRRSAPPPAASTPRAGWSRARSPATGMHDAWRFTPSAELAYVEESAGRLHQLGRHLRARPGRARSGGCSSGRSSATASPTPPTPSSSRSPPSEASGTSTTPTSPSSMASSSDPATSGDVSRAVSMS